MRIVCIGDSITAGQYLPSEQAWPQQLAELTGYEVLNAGVSNETTRQGLERFPRHVQERWPDVVIIQFGLNDCNRWDTDNGLPRVRREAYRENLIEMVERSKASGAEAMICDLTPTQKSLQHMRDRNEYSRSAERAASDTGVGFIRAGLTIADLLDDMHLTAEGHRVFAEAVASCLPAS